VGLGGAAGLRRADLPRDLDAPTGCGDRLRRVRALHPTDRFLAGHLVGSIFCAALAILGALALAAYLAETRAGGRALLGMTLTVVGFPFIIALFGVAAFAQPAIGGAHLAGQGSADTINDAVYGTTAIASVLVGVLLYSFAIGEAQAVGAVLFTTAGLMICRSALARPAGAAAPSARAG
jgi:hypothetical protein